MTSVLRTTIAFSLLAAAWSLAPAPLLSQEGPEEEQHESAEHEGGRHHKNEFGLVLGGTYEAEEEQTFFTFGLEYVRMTTDTFHFSVVAEYIDDVDAWVFIAPVHIHPWESSGFFFVLGPGLEHKSRRGPGGEGAEASHTETETPEEPEQAKNLFLWRTGVGYKFELTERFDMGLGLDWDVVREDGEWVNAFVFDVALGFDF